MKSSFLLAFFALAIPPLRAAAPEDSLKSFLQAYLKDPLWNETDFPTRYMHAFVDLNGDGKPEAIVYLLGGRWCGTSGCTMLILRQEAPSFNVVSKTLSTRPPIRVLPATSHGWRNLSVLVASGITESYQSELRFNGKTYPWSPSLPPARRLDSKSSGKVIFEDYQSARPLFP